MSLSELAQLQRGRNIPAHHSGEPPSRPPWLDIHKFNRGRQFFKDYLCCCFLAMFTSLVCGLGVKNLLVALVFTHASDEPKKALMRYMQTFRDVVLWHYGDVWDSSTDAYKSVARVRKIHDKVAADMNSRQETPTLHFSQYDMALVQCGFMGALVMYSDAFGACVSGEQIEAYVHFWRGIGYLLGIDEEYNLCRDGWVNAKAKCQAIEQHVLLPAMKDPPKDFYKMAEALIGGSNIPWGFKLFSLQSILAFSLDTMKEARPSLGIVDKLRLYFLKCLTLLFRSSRLFRKLLNTSVEKQMFYSPNH